MKKKNEKFAADARAGKKPTKLSRQERLAKRSPINLWALGAVVFVVCGGGELRRASWMSQWNLNFAPSDLRACANHLPSLRVELFGEIASWWEATDEAAFA